MNERFAIEKVLPNRELESAQLVVEWHPLEPSKEKNVARAVSPLLRNDYPQSEGEVAKPPSGLVFVGHEKTAQVIPGSFNIQIRFKHDHRKVPDLAFELLERKWSPLENAIQSVVVPRFAGLVVGLEFSTKGIGFDGPKFLATYMKTPGIDPIDAEWRVAFPLRDRFIMNLSMSTFKKTKISLRADGGETKVHQDTLDFGIAARIDVNTKLLSFRGEPDAEVTEHDFSTLRALAREAVDETLPKLLNAAP